MLPTLAPDLAYEGLAKLEFGADVQTGDLEKCTDAAGPAWRTAIRAALLDYSIPR